MWTEFEWENRVVVATPITDLQECSSPPPPPSLRAREETNSCPTSPHHRPRAPQGDDQHAVPHARRRHARRLRLSLGQPLRTQSLWRGRPRELVDREGARRSRHGACSHSVKDPGAFTPSRFLFCVKETDAFLTREGYRVVVGGSDHYLPEGRVEVVPVGVCVVEEECVGGVKIVFSFFAAWTGTGTFSPRRRSSRSSPRDLNSRCPCLS